MAGISNDTGSNFETIDCLVCQTQDTGDVSVGCDKCLRWTHVRCTNLTQQEIDKILNYFCKDCRDKGNLIIWRGSEPTEEQRQMKSKLYFEVDKIKGYRAKGEHREFLVEWKNCPVRRGSQVNVRSWEPEKNLDGCLDLLQHYCMTKGIPLSGVQGLLGADPDEEGFNEKNWITMKTILTKFADVRKWLKTRSTLKASEWTGFGNQDELFFIRHDHHCFVLLYISEKRLAYIADGGNVYRTNQQVANELKQRLKIRLVSLEFNQQLKIDHCGSSSILIGIELLKLHSRGIDFQELIASKKLRADLIKSFHTSESKPLDLPSLRQRRKMLTCKFCGRTFKTNQGRALSTHINRTHKK